MAAGDPPGGQLVAPAGLDLDAELLEGVDVGVEPAPADHVAARRRHRGAAQRASSGPASRNEARMRRAQLLVRLGLDELGRVDVHLVRPDPLRVRAEIGEELDHRLDVADARHVVQRHRLAGEQRGGEDRERAVLVARRAHGAESGRPPSITKDSLCLVAIAVWDMGAARPAGSARTAGYRTRRRGSHTRARLGDPHPLHAERRAAEARARGRGLGAGLRARTSARTRSSGA